jgi:hypothetical protein
MDAYTFGSPEGFAALRSALLANPGEGHYFTLSVTERAEMADALETAAFAGKPWGEVYTGIPVHEAALWPERLAELALDDMNMLTLIEALEIAYHLGDEFSGQWLSGLAECVDIEWI